MHFEEIPYLGSLSATTMIAVSTSQQKSVPLALLNPTTAAAVKAISGPKLVAKPTMAIPSTVTAPTAPVRPPAPPTTTVKTPGGSIPVRTLPPLPPDPVSRLVPTGTTFPTGKWNTPLPAPPATAPSFWPPKTADGSYHIPDSIPAQFTAEVAASPSELTASQASYATSAEGAASAGAEAGSPFLTPEENAAMKPVARPLRGFGLLLAGGVAAFVYWKFYAKG